MAVTITRTADTDDDGTGTTGTIRNNAWKTTIYNQIDTALALLLPLAGGTLTGDLVALKVTVGPSADVSALTVAPTHATYTGTALFVNTTRAANSAFNLLALQANSVGQFTVRGDGLITAAGSMTLGGTKTISGYDAAAAYGLTVNTQSNASGAAFVKFQRSGSTTCGAIDRVGATDAVTYGTSSSRKLKKNITKLDAKDCLDRVMRLSTYRWDWKNDKGSDSGFIFDEVADLFPTAVSPASETVDYGRISYALVAAIQNIAERVQRLEA
jgi:hypothetical protein